MKKGVVLIITIFFITAISALVLKNLDDTDIFLEEQNYKINNTQILISIKNTQEEVSKIIVNNEKYVKEVLEDNEILFPIEIESLKVTSTIKNYDKVNINDINNEESKTVENLFYENDIFDYAVFKEIYQTKLQTDGSVVETTKQLDDIIDTFILKTENETINKIVDSLGFLSTDSNYELNITSEYLGSKSYAYYILNKEGKVQYFDISFK